MIIDIDECVSGSHNCEQICMNNNGSFECSCNDGFKLSTDRKSCVGKQSILYH